MHGRYPLSFLRVVPSAVTNSWHCSRDRPLGLSPSYEHPLSLIMSSLNV